MVRGPPGGGQYCHREAYYDMELPERDGMIFRSLGNRYREDVRTIQECQISALSLSFDWKAIPGGEVLFASGSCRVLGKPQDIYG